MEKLPAAFYGGEDVMQIARALLGKVLVTAWAGVRTTGRIVETEAYAGLHDKASHAYRGKTARTAVLFETTGTAYVYLCYGLHQMFNIATATAGVPHAVLVRAVEPLEGIDMMLQRTGKKVLDASLTRGPGNVGKAFGFHRAQSGLSLQSEQLYIADNGFILPDAAVGVSPRIGVAYAAEDALLPYRFYIRSNPFVSGKPRT
jgi:DNA-3-methyladenine glycosylase